MKFKFDKEADALYIRFNNEEYSHSDETREGVVLDYNQRNKLIGIEILDVSKRFPLDFLSQLSLAKQDQVEFVAQGAK